MGLHRFVRALCDQDHHIRPSIQGTGAHRSLMMNTQGPPSPWLRLYIYGIHGYVVEVMFTAVWEFVVNTNWKLPGCSSVWSLFIYAVSVYVIERLHLRLHSTVPWPARGLVYLIWTFAWEFSTGLLLRNFHACPWDYTANRFNVLGLITLEYAPLWYTASLLTERLLIKNTLSLGWPSEHHHQHKL